MKADKFLFYFGAIIFSIAFGFYVVSISKAFMAFGFIVMAVEGFIGCLAYINGEHIK